MGPIRYRDSSSDRYGWCSAESTRANSVTAQPISVASERRTAARAARYEAAERGEIGTRPASVLADPLLISRTRQARCLARSPPCACARRALLRFVLTETLVIWCSGVCGLLPEQRVSALARLAVRWARRTRPSRRADVLRIVLQHAPCCDGIALVPHKCRRPLDSVRCTRSGGDKRTVSCRQSAHVRRPCATRPAHCHKRELMRSEVECRASTPRARRRGLAGLNRASRVTRQGHQTRGKAQRSALFTQ